MGKTVEESRNITTCTLQEGLDLCAQLISTLEAEECPPVLLIGPVGMGKTEGILQMLTKVKPAGFKEPGVKALVRHLSQVHPLDMGGVGLNNDTQEMYYAAPPLFNEWKRESQDGRLATAAFFDEIDRAQPIAQSSMLQYLLSREINGYKAKNNYAIAAANGWHAQYTYELDKATASRFVILHVESRPDDWLRWAATRNVDPRVLATVAQRPDVLNQHGGISGNDKNNQANDGALKLADPRSWKKLSDALKGGFPVEMAAAFVGSHAGETFRVFASIQKDYSKQIQQVLKGKKIELTESDLVSNKETGAASKARLNQVMFCIYLAAAGQVKEIDVARSFLKNGIEQLDKEKIYIASRLITYNIEPKVLCQDPAIQKMHIDMYNETYGDNIKA